MNSEIVDALFGLLQQRVAEGFPGKILGDPVDLFQRLVDRHRADWYWAITQDPLTGFVNIAPGGKVHYRIRPPARRPHQFFHLFFDRGGHRRVADIGVDLHQEVAANNHRLRFRVVDVGGDDGASGGDFITHEFRGDVFRQACAKAHPRMLVAQYFTANALAAHIFTDGDELHFGSDDPVAGVV
ncbi:hypothetical protein NGUA18_01882 [Salmonella enterica]|nr:hypothetical protein NGUA18_01882 [Salmonella enterica]